MVNNNSRKRSPPYVSYRTFLNFIDGLQQRVPARIDRSYWGDMLSGSTGTQLMAALRFLGLIDADGKPTEQLKPLVSARGEQRRELLKEIAYESFGFVLQGAFDPQNATYAQLREVFHNTFLLTEDVNRKCIKFFISLVSDIGLPLSPFITKRSRLTRTSSGTKSTAKKMVARTKQNLIIPQHLEEIPDGLLAKFPTFDPSWPDEVKLKWFDAFDKLLMRSLSKNKI
ncbi:hypothetical protein ACFLVH_00725 [Chloroflexota bacterium]